MKYMYLSGLLCFAFMYSSEKLSPDVLPIIESAMANEVANFDLLFSDYRFVKKPLVELAEVSCEKHIYLICLRSGFIYKKYTPANHSKW